MSETDVRNTTLAYHRTIERDESCRAAEISAHEVETRDRTGQQADEREAQQERATQRNQDQSGEGDDQQRPKADPQGRGGRGKLVFTTGDEWHPQEVLSRARGGATHEEIVVSRLEPDREGSLHHRLIAALGTRRAATAHHNQQLINKQARMIGDSLKTGDKMSPALTDHHHNSLTIAR